MILSSIHVAARGIVSLFLMAEWYSIVCVYCVLICSSVSEQFGCSRVTAIVNSAAVNIGVDVSFQFSPDICPGVGLLDHMITLFLVYPPWWLYQFTFLPTV